MELFAWSYLNLQKVFYEIHRDKLKECDDTLFMFECVSYCHIVLSMIGIWITLKSRIMHFIKEKIFYHSFHGKIASFFDKMEDPYHYQDHKELHIAFLLMFFMRDAYCHYIHTRCKICILFSPLCCV